MEERDPILEARLKEQFQGCCFGGAIHAFTSCDSTMERAHALARDGAGEGTLVFATRQTQGRGRLGRRWESPDGGAYFSLILKPSRPPTETPQLSLVAGLSAAETIHEQLTPLAAGPGSPTVSIRWPNDILLDGKKVAGILTEAKDGAVVVGIGINVTTDPRDLPETATSLLEACGGVPQAEIPSEAVRPSRGKAALVSSSDPRSTIHDPLGPLALVSALCRKFDGWYDVWTTHGFAPIREALRPWLNLGGMVRLTTNQHAVEGQATDVDEQGRLVVRLESGVVKMFEAGEVTLLR